MNRSERSDLLGRACGPFCWALGLLAVQLFAACRPAPFANAVRYPVGFGPTEVAVGDVNGDGKLDLVVSDTGAVVPPGHTLSVLLGNGDGTFQPAKTSETATGPGALVLGDFNRDGKLDVAVAAGEYTVPAGSGLAVQLGAGDGTFGAPTSFPVGTNPNGIAMGDFNGDGILDLAVTNQEPTDAGTTLTVLLGHGDGTFNVVWSFGAGSAIAVATADLNSDGKPDLVYSSWPGSFADGGGGTVIPLLGNGDWFLQRQTMGLKRVRGRRHRTWGFHHSRQGRSRGSDLR